MNRLGAVVVWGQLDCSELVAECLLGVGGPDLRATHRAKDMAHETRPLAPGEDVYPGDLAFYGKDAELWRRRWRLFFLATAGLFGHRGGEEWGVSHYRLAPA